MYLFSDAAKYYSDNINGQVDMVEVKTKPNESDDMLSVCKNNNMFDNFSRNVKTTSESKI